MTSPEPAPPADPTSYRRRGFGGWTWVVAGLCVLSVAGGIYIARHVPALFPVDEKSTLSIPTIPFIAPGPEPEAPSVETAAAPLAPPPEPVAGGDLAGLKTRVERLEATHSRTAEAAGVALATAALIEASQTSRPFDNELAQVSHLLPQSADVVALRALARTGAATRQVLAAEFSDAASGAIAAAAKPGPDAGLMQRIGYAISSVITIRRVGDVRGRAVDAVLARAETAARDGDLEQALKELSTLPPTSRQALSDWISDAVARVEIDRRVANIRDASLRAINETLASAP
jgi:hypothetical protein